MTDSSQTSTVAANSSLKRSSTEEKENEEADTCSLQDVIDVEKERNEIASAVLGASDATNCSYNQGYVYRQALYCCVTCLKESQPGSKSIANLDDQQLHGICLAW